MSKHRIEEEKSQGLRKNSFAARKQGVARAWFHAASVGELESLTPVIQAWLLDGSEALVTVLSESAKGAVGRLRSLEGSERLLYAAYSPWEGHWREVLRDAQVDVFVTAKYEAWPELWDSLAQLKIALLIVSAKARRSLRIVGTLCRVLGAQVPRLTLLTVNAEDSQELGLIFGRFPGVRVLQTGEPRWDRVSDRAKQGNPRAKELVNHFRGLPRPWGVLAQVWPEDMEVWRGHLGQGKGTLWVVPHRTDDEHVEEVERYLIRGGLRVERTSQLLSESLAQEQRARGGGAGIRAVDCVLVDETGALLELYASIDWVYVGGGFGVSMHSTIEPALFGVPVSCGPSGESKFPEITELTRTGQLTLIQDGDELAQWLEDVAANAGKKRAYWKSQADERLGATHRVLAAIKEACAVRG